MDRLFLAASLAVLTPFVPAAAQDAPSPASTPAPACDDAETRAHAGGVVTVTGVRPTSLPTAIPTTTVGATGEDIARTVNATDSEDALKYFPSLLVRKRYIGDYNHAILSSRASGTGNSARSAVYADGILLSNYLGNGVGGLSFPPRWGLVTPEEIDRVDVMYGPFSAAYPGNSVGAVVDYVTRMPTRFEAHAQAGYEAQPVSLYGTNHTYRAWQTSASVGSRAGDLAWWIDASHVDSQSQPLTFATRQPSVGTAGPGGTPVSGAVAGASPTNQPWVVLGAGTQYDSRQDHLKLKLADDLTPTLRASYVFGLWQNNADGNSTSYLRDANGQPVYSGGVNVGGVAYTGAQALGGGDFPVTRETLRHTMHGLSIKRHASGEWDWEAAASLYDYGRDEKRQNGATNVLPDALSGGPGTLADGAGTGWNTLALKGTWRPPGAAGAHVVDLGIEQDSDRLRYVTANIAGDYLSDAPTSLASAVHGKTRLQGAWAQDLWRLSPRWTAVLGARAEHWDAYDGRTDFSSTSGQAYASRHEDGLSPKAALSWQATTDAVLKASLGRAVRFPTVSELYGATSTTNSQYINDPNLAPERSWTSELSAETAFERATTRLTLFAEDTRDALYAQTTFDANANKNISRTQNVGRIATTGLEAALDSDGLWLDGLRLSGSVTYADSTIRRNAGFVAVPGDTIGRRQPNVPRWRATVLASYAFDPRLSGSLGVRYSGPQFRTLNNADTHGDTYQGVSPFLTADLRLRCRFTRQWSGAFGIDNLNDDRYWNFHPYPQRTYSAELKFDL